VEECNYGMLIGQKEPFDLVQYEDYRFDFIRKSNELSEVSICPKDDYLTCKTLDNKDMLIYIHDEFKVYGKMFHLSSGMFIRGCFIDSKLKGIRFNGGVLSNLFTPEAFETEAIKDGTVLRYKDDSIRFDTQIAGRDVEIKVASGINERNGVLGSAITNDHVGLEIIYKDGLLITDIRPTIFAVLEMCQFMSCRKNVGFESIELLEEYSVEEKTFNTECADIFFRYEYQCFTEKKWVEFLSFGDLGKALPTLFKAMYLKGREDTDFFTIDYLAEEDRDAFWFNEQRIKEICTAVENEAERHGLVSETNAEFEELKKKAKTIIKEFKDKDWMSDRTYNMLNSDVNHWDYSAYDKYIMLFRKYEELVIQSSSFKGSIADFEESIGKVIKYRNNSTHGSHIQITPEIAETAYNLMLLIYCSRLDYLGISDEIIREKIKCRAYC